MGSSYKNIFTPITIRGVEFKNRIEMAPTSPKFTTADGHVTTEHIEYFRAPARGGAAIITLGNCSVDMAHAQDEPRQVALDNDSFMSGLGRFADMCERYGVIPSAEVNHAGLDIIYDFNGVPAIGPSSIIMEKEYEWAALKGREPVPSIEMDRDMIHAVQQMYIDAAFRLKRVGFKMCMIHGGHGNLIPQFTSPLYNHRKDEYGGSLENRARFGLEILDGVRKKCGEDFVIEFRVSADEMHPDGVHFDEMKEYLKMLDDKVDIINVSCGLHSEYKYFRYWSPNMYMPEMINVKYARELKKLLRCKINTVAGIMNLDNAERILSEGWADFVSMARPLMADPEMVNKYAADMPGERRPCTRCGYCGRRMMGERTTACAVNPLLGRESELINGKVPPADVKKKVVVIGAGPGGMQTALTLTERGHDVTLLERDSDIGGHLAEAACMDAKVHMREYLTYIKRQVREHVSDVRTGTAATPELVMSLKPDAIVIATGADPRMPGVPGIDLPHVHWAADADMGRCEVGQTVAIIGGGPLGLESAVTQSSKGKKVLVFEIMPVLGSMEAASELMPVLEKNGAEVRVSRRLDAVCDGKITVTNTVTGETEEYGCDTVLVSAGMLPRKGEAERFRHLLPETNIYIVGDVVKPRGFGEATREGFNAAMNI